MSGRAYRLAALSDVRGAFNIAADPVIDTRLLAKMVKRAHCARLAGSAPRRSRDRVPVARYSRGAGLV